MLRDIARRQVRALAGDQRFQLGLIFHDAARRHPDTPVHLDEPLAVAPGEGLDHTVAGLAGKVDALADALADAGVRPRQHVAIHKTDNLDIALLACAVSRLGAVPALLAPALAGEIVTSLLDRLDRPWLVTDADTLTAKFGGTAPPVDLRGVVLSSGRVPGTTTLEPRPAAPTRPPVLLEPDEPALITHSSGTTGTPKLAVHTVTSLWHRLVPQKVMAWPIRGKETVGFCMTVVHSRFYNALRVFLDYGNPLVLAIHSEPAAIGPLFARYRPGYVETHPNTYIEWEELADSPDRPLAYVRIFSGTFDAPHPRTIGRLLAASCRARPLFFQLYGQSETGPVTARWHTARSVAKGDSRCVGLPLPGFTRVRITDDDGNVVPRGRMGHIEAKVRSRVLTYYGEDDRFRAELRDGWWAMGDEGYQDRYGLVHLYDRKVDQIDSMPSNLEAEDVLMERMAELREVAIVAGSAGEPVPVVCTRDERPLDLGRWREATDDLDHMADPVQLPFDELPRTSTWKVQRSQLVRQLRARS